MNQLTFRHNSYLASHPQYISEHKEHPLSIHKAFFIIYTLTLFKFDTKIGRRSG